MVKFFSEASKDTLAALAPLVEVGLNHEQQHQELMLTDILHAFAQNPIPPAYDPAWRFPTSRRSGDEWVTLGEGIHSIGHAGETFHFDNEKPAHRALVGPVKLKRHLVTNAEWLAFMADGGYTTPTLWLMDGFATVGNEAMAGARPLAADRRRMAGHDARRFEAGRPRRPGLPRQLL